MIKILSKLLVKSYKKALAEIDELYLAELEEIEWDKFYEDLFMEEIEKS